VTLDEYNQIILAAFSTVAVLGFALAMAALVYIAWSFGLKALREMKKP